MDTYRILLLDDDDFILAALRRELLSMPYIGHAGLEIETFTSPEEHINFFIGKPWHDYELRAAIARALSHREMEPGNRFLANLLLLKEKTLKGKPCIKYC